MAHVYDSGKFGIAGGTIRWATDDVRVLLLRPTYVFNATHTVVADVSGHELGDPSYSRQLLAGRSVQEIGANADFIAQNPTFLALAGGEPIASVVVYQQGTDDSSSPLIAWIDVAAHTSDGSDYTVRWNNQSPSGAVFRMRSPSAPNASGLIQLHDLTHEPVALWQFQESLNDVSGNAFDLALLAGDQRFTEMLPGVAALNLFVNNKFRHNVQGTFLEIRGDLTIEMLVRLRGLTSGAILSYDTNTENESGNFLYSVGLTAAPTQTQFASEHGAGVDDAHGIPLLLPVCQPVHFAVRRQSDVIQFFLNGKPWGPASAPLATPTGGEDSVFYLGWANNPTVDCDIASLKICASALSDAEVLAEYNRTLGPFYGIRT